MVQSVYDMRAAKNADYGAWIYENTGSCWVTLHSPEKWEAGTLPLTQIAGLIPAIDYLEKNRPDTDLIKYAYDELSKLQGVKILTKRDAAILSFVIVGMHPLDVGTLIGANDICVRAGNMCASWIHQLMGVPGSIRLSIGSWNTIGDIKKFVSVMKKIVK